MLNLLLMAFTVNAIAHLTPKLIGWGLKAWGTVQPILQPILGWIQDMASIGVKLLLSSVIVAMLITVLLSMTGLGCSIAAAAFMVGGVLEMCLAFLKAFGISFLDEFVKTQDKRLADKLKKLHK